MILRVNEWPIHRFTVSERQRVAQAACIDKVSQMLLASAEVPHAMHLPPGAAQIAQRLSCKSKCNPFLNNLFPVVWYNKFNKSTKLIISNSHQ